MPDKPSYQTPHILPDNPIQDSAQARFHFEDFAKTLARLIADRETQTPLTIGISGEWGSGKTTLLRCIQEMLNQTRVLLDHEKDTLQISFANPEGETAELKFRVCRCVWFNAWKYANEDKLLIALVREIVKEMGRDDFISRCYKEIFNPIPARRDVLNTFLSWFKFKTPVFEFEPGTGEPQQTPFAENTAILDLFNESFDRLMTAWVYHQTDPEKIDPAKGVLVIFIDDLDRCLPEKTVQVLESVKLFLDKPGCVFVIGADADIIQKAVHSHYANFQTEPQYAVDYLDKIIQLRFDLPPVAADEMQKYLKTQNVAEDMLAQWKPLIAAAAVNPRRVKAVFNDIELQWKILVNSRQAQDVKQDDFIRWSALLRAAPFSFRQVLTDITDLELRFKFIQDALRWGRGEGDEPTNNQFQKYERPGRLRSVLHEIGVFSSEFDAKTLDAFIHLTAPPPKPAQVTEQKLPIEGKPEQEAVEMERMPAKGITGRGEAEPSRLHEYGGIQFVPVPAGKFLMGSKEDNELAERDEKPQLTAETGEYWLARFPITNTQFEAFVKASSFQTTAEKEGSGMAYDGKEWKDAQGAEWKHPQGPESSLEGKEDHPVVQVSWQDGMAYCQWLNQAFGSELPEGWVFRLPTEAEWEKAARGEYGQEWPWGSEFDAKKCNSSEGGAKGTTPVGAYSPQGDSPYGAADLVGNVWEWTHSLWKNYPYQAKDGREAEEDSGGRVLRGGSFDSYRRYVRCACRSRFYPRSRFVGYGFRVVASPIHF